MRFVTADGVALHVDQAGDGPPMVFQHGLCGDSGQTAQVFPDDAGFRRITLDCRGHGRSAAGPAAAFSLAQFTADLAAMIRDRQLAPVVAGGISMGAAIALRLAMTEPALVRALVLARPAWGTAASPPNMEPNALVGRMLAQGGSLAEFDASTTARHLAGTAPDNLASLRGFFGRAPRDVTAALLTRISADGPGIAAADLAALRLPVLVIGHDRDAVHPLALARDLARAIPGARFAEITPKASDPAAYRQDFRAALAAFLKGL